MEHTQSRENREGDSSSRDSYRYDNDQSQKGRWHDGGGGQRHDRDVGWQPNRNGGGRGYGRGRGRFNRPYSGNVRDGFDHPSYPNAGTRNQEYAEGNDNSNRSRPHDKHSEDHMRDSSPDRNDRARPTDKQYEDHARDQSPDRSSNEQYQYIQGTECGTNNKSMNWNQSQSQHYQGNCGESDQGYQQGYDNQFDGKQDYYNYTGSQGQGGYGAYGNQQSSNLNYKLNKNWNQQEPYGYWDDSKHEEFPKDRRPRNRFSEDHMRDPSPDRNDRVRHKYKQNEDHAREPSPDRSSNEQYTQRAECVRNNDSMKWKQGQSDHYQGNSGNSEQVYQQGYDNQYDGKRDYYSQSQGRHGTYGGQQSSNWNYKQNKHNKDRKQQEPYGYCDDSKHEEFPKDRRPSNRVSEDHMRDPSPDRNDRVRHKDKQNEDHAREPSPDRSSNEQYTQRAECVRNNDSMKWKQGQSKHYQGNSGNSEQVYQQGYDNQYDGKRDYYSQSQGRHGTYGGQQSSNWNYKQNKHNKDRKQQEPYGYCDDSKHEEFPKDRRPSNRVSEDHMRDPSPDRNDRVRHKDKQNEDHAREPSPDRSSNEQYTQRAECVRNNDSMKWKQGQSKHYQGNSGNSEQVYQQGYDNQYDGKQDYYSGSQGQGRYGAYGNQQSSNWNYNHNKYWNQQDGNKQKEFQKHRRPRNRFSEDHMRDPSPDRNDSVRHKYKQNEDHAREPSRDRSSNEQYIQRAECVRNNDSMKWKQGQSKHYQGNSGNSEQVYQQGYDNQYDGKQDYYSGSQGQGRYGAYGNQQSSNWNYNHNKYWNQQDGNKEEEFQKDRRPRNRVENLDLKPLLSHVEATLVIHGTYFNSWEKIKLTGLIRMGRNHIHFAAVKPGENGVISEIRSSCEVMIYINLQKALEGGLKFFWSANNVILSPGNEAGVIPPAYFEAVVLRNPRQRLDFDQNVTITRVPVGGESLAQGKSKKKKKGKGGDEDKGEGTEKKSKKEKNEIDDIAIEDTGSLFNEEKIEVQEEDVQRVVEKKEEKIEGQEENVQRVVEKKEEKLEVEEENVQRVVEKMEVTEQKAPEKWDEVTEQKGAPRKWDEDAVDGDDEFQDTENGSDVIDEPRQRLDFDQNVTITRVPVGGESLAQGKSKKKKKGKGGDEDKGEGTEKKSKKEKNEIYDIAIEDTGSLFNEEKIEVQEEDVQRVVEKKEEKIEGQEENVQRVVEKKEEKLEVEEENVQRVVEKMEVTEQKAPEKWDEVTEQKAAPRKWDEDAVDGDDEFQDTEDGSDVIDEPIVIEDAPASVRAVDYLKDQEVVAVYCDQSEDTFSKIVCAVSDKFYIFDIQKTPDIMSEGKLAEFFNSKENPEKVFHGLTSRICATFFEKFEIILDGTKIFDLKMAYDIMNTQGLGNMRELKQTRYDPKSVPTSLESCDVMAYLKGFQYLDKVMKNETKDYKKQLFKMVKADICDEQMKKLRDQRKKELKKSLNQAQAPSKSKAKKKKNNYC